MAYTPYYAPYYRPMNYYNPSIPQDNQNMQNGQQFQQIPVQQPQQMTMQTPIQQMPMSQTAQMPSNDMLWVLNETEATSYPVAPNNSVTLWDKNKDTVYIKSVNMQGVPSMRILDYVERGIGRGYSRDEATDHLMRQLGNMMEDADPKQRETLKKWMRELERD